MNSNFLSWDRSVLNYRKEVQSIIDNHGKDITIVSYEMNPINKKLCIIDDIHNDMHNLFRDGKLLIFSFIRSLRAINLGDDEIIIEYSKFDDIIDGRSLINHYINHPAIEPETRRILIWRGYEL